jgi:hypothetical protein
MYGRGWSQLTRPYPFVYYAGRNREARIQFREELSLDT